MGESNMTGRRVAVRDLGLRTSPSMSDLGILGLRTSGLGPPCRMVYNYYPSGTWVGPAAVQVQLLLTLPLVLTLGEVEPNLVPQEIVLACRLREAQVLDVFVLRVVWRALGCLWVCVVR